MLSLACVPGMAPQASKSSNSTSWGSKSHSPILIASNTVFGTAQLLAPCETLSLTWGKSTRASHGPKSRQLTLRAAKRFVPCIGGAKVTDEYSRPSPFVKHFYGGPRQSQKPPAE